MSAKKGEKNPERLPYGDAKIQFIENIDEIKELIKKGYGLYQIYTILYEEGKITMKYRSFYGLARPDKEKEHRQKNKNK